MQFNSGDIFAEHYQLKKKLGTGSFGEVWLARNTLADVEVAIKFYGLLDDNGIKDFREEFKLAYKLHHPNLLHFTDQGSGGTIGTIRHYQERTSFEYIKTRQSSIRI